MTGTRAVLTLSRTVMAGLMAAVLATACWSLPAAAADVVEHPDIAISMGGLGAMYIPVPIAQSRGYFAAEGLRVRIDTFEAGGGHALQALIGGSAEAVAGYYDHTIQMQAQNKHITCVTLLDELPGLVLAVRKDLAGEIKSLADLKGRRVGVTDLGGGSFLQLRYLASTAGVQMEDMTVLAVGTGATSVAAVEHRQVDALMAYEPGATLLEQRNLIATLIDARTRDGTIKAYGTIYPAACMYVATDFMRKNPVATQHLVNAVVHALRWMHTATTPEIVAALPPDFSGGDRKLLEGSIAHTRPGFPEHGRFDRAVLAHAVDVLASINPKIRKEAINVDETFTNQFVDAVP